MDNFKKPVIDEKIEASDSYIEDLESLNSYILNFSLFHFYIRKT